MRPVYTLDLHSRTEMVGNRRVEIHEMTKSEITWLREQRILFGVVGFVLGFVMAASVALFQINAVK